MPYMHAILYSDWHIVHLLVSTTPGILNANYFVSQRKERRRDRKKQTTQNKKQWTNLDSGGNQQNKTNQPRMSTIAFVDFF